MHTYNVKYIITTMLTCKYSVSHSSDDFTDWVNSISHTYMLVILEFWDVTVITTLHIHLVDIDT